MSAGNQTGRAAGERTPLVFRIEGYLERFAGLMAYVGGAAFLLLAIFMSGNAILRYLALPFSTISDDVAVLVLGFASTWALAYALARRAHVEIDVLLPIFSARFRRYLAVISLVCTTVIAGTFAIQSWVLCLESYELGITSVSMLRFPLFIPQAVVAAGLTLLALQAALMSIAQTMRHRLDDRMMTQTSAV